MKIDFNNMLEQYNDPIYVEACFNILTSIEKSIILVLHHKQAALYIKQIRDELLSYKLAKSSFEKVNTNLENLKNIGIVIFRETNDKKSKGLWALNPFIEVYMKKSPTWKSAFPESANKGKKEIFK